MLLFVAFFVCCLPPPKWLTCWMVPIKIYNNIARLQYSNTQNLIWIYYFWFSYHFCNETNTHSIYWIKKDTEPSFFGLNLSQEIIPSSCHMIQKTFIEAICANNIYIGEKVHYTEPLLACANTFSSTSQASFYRTFVKKAYKFMETYIKSLSPLVYLM